MPSPFSKPVPKLASYFNSCHACFLIFSHLCLSPTILPGPYSTSSLILGLSLYFRSRLFCFWCPFHLAFPIPVSLRTEVLSWDVVTCWWSAEKLWPPWPAWVSDDPLSLEPQLSCYAHLLGLLPVGLSQCWPPVGHPLVASVSLQIKCFIC